MRRLDDYDKKNPSPPDRRHDKRLGVGIIFIFIGAVLVLSNIGIMPAILKNYIFSWQMILIVIGLFSLANKRDKTLGLVLISVGVFFILPGIFGIPGVRWGKFWPVLFVFIGAYILFRRKIEPVGHSYIESDIEDEDFIDDLNVFSGNKRHITSQKFRGGRTTALFGGSDYSFLKADLAGNHATIDVLTIFGGSKFVVPADWDVTIDVISIFGGFADKRNTLNNVQIKYDKKLIIKGLTIFGGGEVKNM